MKRIIFLAVFLVCVSTVLVSPTVGSQNVGTNWLFVVVETRVHDKAFEIDDEHPQERRWYISNVLPLPDDIKDYSVPKKAGVYFDANVVAPAEKHGVILDYYDQELEINGGSVVGLGSRAEAEEMRNKDLEDRKGQGGNIYSFNFTFGPAKGEETSQPRLIYRDKKQHNYEPSGK